jgi:hypothetical protein
MMAYVTRQFTHIETLDRARRWLIQAGIDPNHIEAHTHGHLRITVSVGQGFAAEVERLIDAAVASDPDGNPSFWDTAHQQHVYPQPQTPGLTPPGTPQSESYVVGWRPLDAEREVTQASTETERQKAFREGKD